MATGIYWGTLGVDAFDAPVEPIAEATREVTTDAPR